MIALVVLAVLAIAALLYQERDHRREVVDIQIALAEERKYLLHQIQANAQNMPYYPQIGPFPPAPPEQKVLTDPSGLISFPDYEDDAIDEVAR